MGRRTDPSKISVDALSKEFQSIESKINKMPSSTQLAVIEFFATLTAFPLSLGVAMAIDETARDFWLKEFGFREEQPLEQQAPSAPVLKP